VNDEVLEFLRSFISGGVNQDFKPWASELYAKLYGSSVEPTRKRILARTFKLTTDGLFCGFCDAPIPSASEPRKCCNDGGREDAQHEEPVR